MSTIVKNWRIQGDAPSGPISFIFLQTQGLVPPHLSNPGSIIVKSYFQVISGLQKSGGTGNPSEYSQLETEAKT